MCVPHILRPIPAPLSRLHLLSGQISLRQAMESGSPGYRNQGNDSFNTRQQLPPMIEGLEAYDVAEDPSRFESMWMDTILPWLSDGSEYLAPTAPPDLSSPGSGFSIPSIDPSQTSSTDFSCPSSHLPAIHDALSDNVDPDQFGPASAPLLMPMKPSGDLLSMAPLNWSTPTMSATTSILQQQPISLPLPPSIHQPSASFPDSTHHSFIQSGNHGQMASPAVSIPSYSHQTLGTGANSSPASSLEEQSHLEYTQSVDHVSSASTDVSALATDNFLAQPLITAGHIGAYSSLTPPNNQQANDRNRKCLRRKGAPNRRKGSRANKSKASLVDTTSTANPRPRRIPKEDVPVELHWFFMNHAPGRFLLSREKCQSMITESEDGTPICKYCNWKGDNKRPQRVTEHFAMHLDYRPYTCVICNQHMTRPLNHTEAKDGHKFVDFEALIFNPDTPFEEIFAAFSHQV